MVTTKRAIVTGASSGIGRATACALVAAGWNVLAVARREAELATLRDEAPPGRIHVCAVDLCDTSAPAAVVAAAQSALGGVDLLVNNAGACRPSEIHDQTDAVIDEMIDLHLRAVIRLCREAAPALVAARGQIINVASIASHIPFEFMATYCATKAAVSMFGRALARELKTKGIRVNTISPDGTDTEIFAKMGVPMDPSKLIPVAEIAQTIVTMTALPPSVDVGEWVVEQRLDPKI